MRHPDLNVRQERGDIESLAESIRQHGVLTAILVERRQDGGFDLVAGFRRVAAAEVAGLDHIPAVVRDPVAGVQRVSDQVAENSERSALRDLDVAGAMQQMLDLGASTEDVAERFATSTDTIDRWRAVLALPAALLTLVRDGTVEVSDIADLGELGDTGLHSYSKWAPRGSGAGEGVRTLDPYLGKVRF